MRRTTFITLADKEFWATTGYDSHLRTYVWHLRIGFDTWEEFINFPWGELPNGVVLHKDQRILPRVDHPGGSFWAYNFDELKINAREQKWKYEHPVAAQIRELEEERWYHDRQMREYQEKVKDDARIVILSLYWNAKKESWQASGVEGSYTVVYTENRRFPDPNRWQKGRYYCQISNYNAFVQEPTAGRRGFKLHVIDPLCRIYNTDSEIAQLMPQSEVPDPLAH